MVGVGSSSLAMFVKTAIVEATTHYEDPDVLIRVSENLGEAMVGINIDTLEEKDKLQTRGW